MSLLRWKELAQRKAKLGHKINYVHDQITKHDIGEKTSQASFTKVFNPITTKLDEVIDSNIDLKLPRKKRPIKRPEVPDYGIKVDDEVEDMGLYDLFDEQPVLPDSDKQLEDDCKYHIMTQVQLVITMFPISNIYLKNTLV